MEEMERKFIPRYKFERKMQEKILKEFECLYSDDERIDKYFSIMREASIKCKRILLDDES